MYNPRTQAWKDIDTLSNPHPVHKCIANLDPGSAITIISMHTAKQLQCPIHQNVTELPLRGVQGSNFEANYHCTVLVGFIGTYWDEQQQQYRNGAYEMVVQALILPTLSVPILIGNQALRDHFYANVPGTLDFTMGQTTAVSCKALTYEVVREHCLSTATPVASNSLPVCDTVVAEKDTVFSDQFRGRRTLCDQVDDDPDDLPPPWIDSDDEGVGVDYYGAASASSTRVPVERGEIPTYVEHLGPPRPSRFPAELWKYVSPKYRYQTVDVFSKFSPERLEEVLGQMIKLDIYDRQSPRGQRTLAQAYYNLDAYFHPIADQPPVVEGTEFRIETTKEVPRVNRHKRLSAIQKASLEARVRKMVRQGKLQPSKSPISLGIVLVEYPDRIRTFIEQHGTQADAAMLDPANEDEVAAFYRLTVDLRPVNEVTVPDMFPLPRLLDLLDSARGSCVFSITDLEDAFFTIALAEADRYKTAFSIHNGHYEFCVMPQGARNAGNCWARHVRFTFDDIPSCEVMVYQDDISAHAPTYMLLFDRMQTVYDRVKAKKNVLKLSKTHLDYPEITFLGHVLNDKGRRPCPKKTAAIRELAMPTTVKEVQCLLGMLTFYRDYIPAFATIATPLYSMLKKGIVFTEVWGEEQIQAVTQTKRLLTSYGPQPDGSCSVLRLPDFNAPYRLHIDAAKVGTGLGAVLLQQDRGELVKYRADHPEASDTPDRLLDIAWHPVAYWSKTITGAQRRYSATELETMALHHAILHFHAYLQNGREFEVITDHKALVFMINRNFNINNSRLARYALDLQGYHFRVTHRDGVKNLDADAVSRLLRQVQSHGDYLTREDLMDSTGVMEYSQDEREYMENEAQYCSQLGVADTDDTDDLITDQFLLHTEGCHLLNTPACHMLTRSQTGLSTQIASPEPAQGLSKRSGKGKRRLKGKRGDMTKQSAKAPTPGALEARLRNPKKWRARYSKESVKWNGATYDLPEVTLTCEETRHQDTVEEQWDADIANEELLAGYQYLVRQQFRGTDGILYEVTRIAVEPETKIAIAYTKEVLSGREPDTALPIFGDNGALELTERHWIPSDLDQGWPETEDAMFTRQQQDPTLSPIIARVQELKLGTADPKGYLLPNRGSVEGSILHGALMRQHPKLDRLTVVVPTALRDTLLKLYHDGWAHPGNKRMYESLRLQYSWPGMRKDIQHWVLNCHACHLRKAKAGAASPPLMIYDRLTRPFERVHIDLTGPLPMTPAGYDYILVFKCALTKWVEIFPIQSKSMERVVECFVDEIYCRHGAPSQIITDRGTEFVNRIMRETCKLLRIKKISTTPGHPQADGMAERQMGTLKDALYHYVNAFQDDWDGYLPVVAHAYRTTVNVVTGYSPFYLLYGREARQPHDQWIQSFTGVSTLPEYVKNLATALAWSWDRVGDMVIAEAQRVSQRAQLPHTPKKFREYKIGELIYMARVPRRTFKSQEMARAVKISRALQARFCGPYRIVGKWSPVLYKVDVNGKIKTVHALKMKSAGRTSEPTYEEALQHHKAPEIETPDMEVTAGDEEIFLLEGEGKGYSTPNFSQKVFIPHNLH